jgi:hypothetical protein
VAGRDESLCEIGKVGALMPSTFGSVLVHKDETGYHIRLNMPRGVDESVAKRMHYAGPRMLMPEGIADLDKWLAARKKEGFTFKKAK